MCTGMLRRTEDAVPRDVCEVLPANTILGARSEVQF